MRKKAVEATCQSNHFLNKISGLFSIFAKPYGVKAAVSIIGPLIVIEAGLFVPE
jgi:hypothetical protein